MGKGKTSKKASKVKKTLIVECLKPINKVFNKITLKHLRANMVHSGRVVNVYMEGEVVKIEDSWIELSLLLLSFLHLRTENKLLKTLIDNKVLTKGFNVTSNPPADINNTVYDKYAIPDTGGLYLITNQNPLIMLSALKSIVSALGIKPEDFKLDVVPLDSSEMAIKLSTGCTELCTKTLNISEAASIIKETASIESITICERRFEVNNFLSAVELVMTFINNNFTEEEIKKSMVCNIADMGISEQEELDGVDTLPIENTKLWLYYTNKQTRFISYINEISNYFDMEDIKVEIKQYYFGG